MDSFSHDHESNTATRGAHSPNHHPDPSKAELIASAKLVAEAAKGGKEVDNAKVAGAAADILNAASHYGKIDENSTLGKVVDKAEDYLHKYHTSHATSTHGHGHGDKHGHSGGGGYGDQYTEMGGEGRFNKYSSDGKPDHHGDFRPGGGHSSAYSEGGHGQYGAEYGDKYSGDSRPDHHGNSRPGHGGHSSSHDSEGGHGHGHGYGEYMKMAGDFLKKH